ncbi:transposable element Tc3 transposase [Trichonephila clavipes]|nr:transposable element Tc3 transposase [Trichonephila clavipes]
MSVSSFYSLEGHTHNTKEDLQRQWTNDYSNIIYKYWLTNERVSADGKNSATSNCIANEKNRRRRAENAAEQYAARLEDAYLRAQHLLFTTLGKASLCDDERSGSPSMSTAEDNVQIIEGILMGSYSAGRDVKYPAQNTFQDGDRFNSCQVIYSQFGLAIHQNDHQARRRFVEWAQNEIAVVPDFHKRILFSDEAHFWLNGYVNKQNCRIWSEANPQVYVETPLHPEKLTVWCALWAGGIIGPYFFKNDEGHNVTVNGDRYRAMITNFFIPELNNNYVQDMWFQQDGATCHTARATIDLLKDTFGDRLISRFGPVNWPPRSCDLTPLDYFLWGYVKSVVYADKPQTLDHLEDNIHRVIADKRPQMLEKVIENWTSIWDYIRASHGSHMPEIIFKM